jgi:hypothetical protein
MSKKREANQDLGGKFNNFNNFLKFQLLDEIFGLNNEHTEQIVNEAEHGNSFQSFEPYLFLGLIRMDIADFLEFTRRRRATRRLSAPVVIQGLSWQIRGKF